MNLSRALACAAFALLSIAAIPSTHASAILDCPFGGTSDLVTRGFYIDDYPGTSLGTVTLAHAATVEGERTIALTARLASYNGTLLGTAIATRTIENDNSPTVFDFGNIAVVAGSRITFQQAVIAGDGNVTFDVGVGPCADVTETVDTAPPLSVVRDDSVGLVVTGDPLSLASATTFMCPFDPAAGDANFTRGIYVTNYGGVTLDTVTLRHRTDTPGVKTITLIARLHAFDGPLVGVATITRDVGATLSETVFDFGDAPVPAGSTITFEHVLNLGTGSVLFDTGFGPCANAVQTNGLEPPLDTEHRQSVGLTITGQVASATPVVVVEYLHTGFGHYFLTADPDEIAGLDGGAYGGVFTRTGQEFLARDGPVPGTVGVCRFFTVAFAPKSSHFYTADADECAGVKLNPSWQYERIAFQIPVPAGGVCGVGLVPVYRMYNNGMSGAPNHRYTTSLTTYTTFTTTMGWAPEGIRFCALPPV